MPATFTITPGDIKGGAFRVTYNTRDLGATIGGVDLTIEEEMIDQKVDQYLAPVGKLVIGLRVTGTLTLAEFDNDNLRDLVNTSLHHSASGKEKIVIPGRVPGEQILSGAALVLHPLALDDSDVTEDVTISNCLFTPGLTVPLKNELRVLPCSFEGFADTSGAAGNVVVIGDTTTTGTGT